MHYFEHLQLGLNTEAIDSFHVGHSVPVFGFWGQKEKGKILVTFTYKNTTGSRTVTITVNKPEEFDKQLKQVKDELSAYFCSKPIKEAKEDPTENVLKDKTII
jgi:hypothetical protein